MTGGGERRDHDRRSSQERRKAERRAAQRRKSKQAVSREQRSSRERREKERRIKQRRSGLDRRMRGRHPAISPRDRERALELPARFAAGSGSPEARLAKIVRQSWPVMPSPDRAGIAEDLLPLLEPLAQGQGQVSDDLKQACVEVVANWLASVRR